MQQKFSSLDTDFDSDPYELINKHAYTNGNSQTQPKIYSYSEIVQSHKITGLRNVNDLHFVRVQTDSVFEAKRRVAVLALISYNVRNHTFIRGYSQKALVDPFFYTALKKLLDVARISTKR